MDINLNSLEKKSTSLKLFIDMNSFFATCEQQVNFWLRGRPIAVCVYTGRNGCIIAPSIEAKQKGIKLGMRLHEAMKICPDLIPLETHPARYREFHIKIINILKQYASEVIPKSIDEAVMDLTGYHFMYKDPIQLAKTIKSHIRREVGDWIKCSIGIAPNAFLAKLASDIKKPDGLVWINEENIDKILSTLKLTDLPGISHGTARRLNAAGIYDPVTLRHTNPQDIKRACKSITGLYWYQRLNFGEVDLSTHPYKSMQARRMVSKEQRRFVKTLEDLFLTLCINLERRMIKEDVFANEIGFTATYENGKEWKDFFRPGKPIQDGIELMRLIKLHMDTFKTLNHCENIINTNMTSMGVHVSKFIKKDLIQCQLFENNVRKDKLRKLIYDIKDKHGGDKLMRAVELRDEEIWRDAIGFGSVKDLH